MATRRDFIKISELGFGGMMLGENAAYQAMAQTFGKDSLGATALSRTPTYCEICFWKCAGCVHKNAEKQAFWGLLFY